MEKIILLCSEIQFNAHNLEALTNEFKHLHHDLQKQGDKQHLREHWTDTITNNEGVLDELISKLYEARENLIDYKNGIDAVSDLDVALSEVVFHAVNDLGEEEIETA